MNIEWIIVHFLCITGALVRGEEVGKEEEETDMKVYDWQPQQVHIAFGGKSMRQIKILIQFHDFFFLNLL